jgi:signal transduction histidine kinase
VAQLAVSDTGVGVPDGEQERVFERFFRGSNIRGAYAGLGVGLYIARAIVERHGGRIWLESQPRLQTTCHVVLPLEA